MLTVEKVAGLNIETYIGMFNRVVKIAILITIWQFSTLGEERWGLHSHSTPGETTHHSLDATVRMMMLCGD